MYRTLVTVSTAHWSLYVPQTGHYIPHSGQYMYRTVVTICTAQWAINVPPVISIYTPHGGQYMSRQWSLYDPPVVTICHASGQYIHRTVVTIRTASGHNMYPTVVTICATILTFTILRSAHTAVFMCFVWISEQTVIISLYSINWLVVIKETQCVYCVVRTECVHIIQVILCFQMAVPRLGRSDGGL